MIKIILSCNYIHIELLQIGFIKLFRLFCIIRTRNFSRHCRICLWFSNKINRV